jgi:hypothetical protein
MTRGALILRGPEMARNPGCHAKVFKRSRGFVRVLSAAAAGEL